MRPRAVRFSCVVLLVVASARLAAGACLLLAAESPPDLGTYTISTLSNHMHKQSEYKYAVLPLTRAACVHVDDPTLAAQRPNPAERVSHTVGEQRGREAEGGVVVDLHRFLEALNL